MSKFVGNKNGVHIHTEGSTYHYKYGTNEESRHDFDINKDQKVKDAYTAFKKLKSTAPWSKDSTGYAACDKWFKGMTEPKEAPKASTKPMKLEKNPNH